MAKRNTRKKAAYRKNLQNRFSMVLVTLVVVVLLVVVGIRSYGLTQKREELQNQMNEVLELQEKEKQKAAELEEYAKYTKTLKFYEEYAKKKLRLVYEDEIIFIKEE
ncbi:MAG: septum formation initiator family protein [Lachnospiraceae bacterium]|nr:septum formation initiator family protein [Lachnospiraceae bacterium]